MRLTKTVKQEYLDTILTHGNRDGECWFLWLDDNIHFCNAKPLDGRVKNWINAGKGDCFRLGKTYGYEDIREISYFDDRKTNKPHIHPLWGPMSRIALGMKRAAPEGETLERDLVRAYQAEKLGTLKGDTCLVELLPLPHVYGSDSAACTEKHAFAVLDSQKAFEEAFLESRLHRIGKLIDKHQPKAVTTFCWQYRESIGRILADFTPVVFLLEEYPNRSVLMGKRDNTSIVVTNKYNYRRRTPNRMCWRIGEEISRLS